MSQGAAGGESSEPTADAQTPLARSTGRAALLASVAAFLAGTLSAMQSRVNGTLAEVFHAPIDAALWSFGSGWVLLTLGLLLPSARAGLRSAYRAYRAQHLTWWQFLGGMFGGFFVAAQTWSVPQIGVAMFTIAIVGGQTLNAMLVDGLGLGPAGKAPVTLARVLGALGTFVGVAIAMVGRGADGSGVILVPVLFAVAAGAGMAVQQAINGRVNRHTDQVLATTWVNFSWGLPLLLGIALAQLAQGTWRAPMTLDAPAWAWMGGVVGIVYIAIGATVVHHLGVLLAVLFTLAGQLIGAVVIDLVSSGQGQVPTLVLVGVAVTLLSAVFAAAAARRARRREHAESASSPGRVVSPPSSAP
ncbi:DMT family transporter [Mobilicoccus massiliensis]|uniref:DMT family transporter n=1 Tax=Mobilicoccus massiliensis TaxID=1522310 RepID=UPI000694A170|nr:DMT family transporter [Mobilicoccus massiliensis]